MAAQPSREATKAERALHSKKKQLIHTRTHEETRTRKKKLRFPFVLTSMVYEIGRLLAFFPVDDPAALEKRALFVFTFGMKDTFRVPPDDDRNLELNETQALR